MRESDFYSISRAWDIAGVGKCGAPATNIHGPGLYALQSFSQSFRLRRTILNLDPKQQWQF